jgi:hypothetical protein
MGPYGVVSWREAPRTSCRKHTGNNSHSILITCGKAAHFLGLRILVRQTNHAPGVAEMGTQRHGKGG